MRTLSEEEKGRTDEIGLLSIPDEQSF